MENQIEQERSDTVMYLQGARPVPEEHQSIVSPSGDYRLETNGYEATNTTLNVSLTVATITDEHSGEIVATINRDHDSFYHCWLTRDGVEYLICSESLEGQTVIDLPHRQVASFYSQ